MFMFVHLDKLLKTNALLYITARLSASLTLHFTLVPTSHQFAMGDPTWGELPPDSTATRILRALKLLHLITEEYPMW